MSKRRSSTPDLPPKMKHYEHVFPTDGIDSVVKESLRTARRVMKKTKSASELLDGDFGNRRVAAIRNTLPRIIDNYDLTTHAGGHTSTAEVWANLNLFPSIIIDEVDDDVSLFLGAALWILDNSSLFDLENLLQDVDYEDDWTLPYFYDLRHTDPVIQAVVYILQYRYKYGNNFLDLDDRPGEAGEAFERVMELIEPDKLRHAVETAKTIFLNETDGFFDVAYKLAEKIRDGVEIHNKAVDMYNDEVDRATPMIMDFLDFKKGKKPLRAPAAGSPLMKSGSPLMKPGSPLMKSGSPDRANISSLMDSLMMPSTTPLGFMNQNTQDPGMEFRNTVEHLATLGARADNLREKADSLYGDLLRFVFSYSHCGFSLSSDYAFHFDGITIPSIDIPDPFEACMGLLILCSPPLYHSLYGNEAEDDDLPWLMGIAAATARDNATFLPWGISAYEEDMVDLREPPKPLKHPEWNARRYQGEDGYERSLSQILYETTGAVLPRNMSGFDNAHHILWHYGIRGKNEAHMAEMMVLLNTPQYRRNLMLDHGEEEEEDTSVDIESLQAQLQKLREQNKKLTDEAHEQERRARKAEQALSAEREKAKADRQELASLREVVFTQDNSSSSEEKVSVTLPYEVKSHIAIYGGHDTWLTPMKEFLTGDIRFMDREQSILDENVMRNADVVWIQPNAISHSKYYKIIGQIRKHDIPVRYFLYASARKCAEQLILSEST